MSVILETSLGDIVVDLYVKERPRCSENFLKLCKIKYYNFCLFHSVQRNLVAQTGDPTSTGKGGHSIYAKLFGEQASFFEAEIKPRIKHEKLGQLSMVNNGDGMHGSQFFLTLSADIDYLNGKHTVFGEIAEGFDVLDKINESYVDDVHMPYKDIRIYHTVVLEDPFPDSDEMNALIPEKSPRPTRKQLQSGRIGVDETLDDTEGMTDEQVQEYLEEREAKANAQILEMVGDLPEADVRPPDNILFVCKLNPVTTSEDLEIIFSRFGDIVECEVIKDFKTNESLQYAFIEFELEKACEQAYFKMDNVLIDDRRIHVDFSQSVSKQWNKNSSNLEETDGRNNYKIKEQEKRYDKYDFVFENDDSSLMDQQQQTLNERKERKIALKAKEKEEQLRVDADNMEIQELQDKRNKRKKDARDKKNIRGKSPSRRSSSPKRYKRKSERSPKRRSRSPKRRSRSPKRRSRSPKRRSRSPKKRSRSPKKRSRSPKRRSRSPKRRSRSPKRRSRSPKRRSPIEKSRRQHRRSNSRSNSPYQRKSNKDSRRYRD